MARDNHATMLHRVLLLAGAFVIIGGLYLAREVLVPIALAILLSFLLSPLVAALERRRLGRVPSVLLTVMVAFTILGGVGWVIADQAVDLASRLPSYQQNIHEKIILLKESGSGALGNAVRTVRELGRDISGKPGTQTPPPEPSSAAPRAPAQVPVPVAVVDQSSNFLSIAVTTLSAILNPLATLFVVIILVIFMLHGRDDLRDRAIRLIGGHEINLTTQALNDAGNRVSRYLFMQLIVNVMYGIPVGIGLYFIGVPNAVLWALLAGVFRFLPYLGPWLGLSFPFLLSLAAPGWEPPILTLTLFVCVELIVNNLVEPFLYGASTGLSPVAILAAAVFWTWLWGFPGLLLSTPLTALLVVMGEYVPQLEFLTILLGDKPALEPHAQFYQRLLSADAEELEDLSATLLENKPLMELYDAVLIPALTLAQRDAVNGRLSPDRLENVRDLLRELVEDLPKREQHIRDKSTPTVPIVLVPARDDSDAIAGEMLEQLLVRDGYRVTKAAPEHLASELAQIVADSGARIVCVSALPPRATAHSRYLCKRLHAKFSEITIIAGLWNSQMSPEAAKRRLTCSERDIVVTTLSSALESIRELAIAQALKETTVIPKAPAKEPRPAAAGRAQSERLQAKPLDNASPARPSDVPVD